MILDIRFVLTLLLLSAAFGICESTERNIIRGQVMDAQHNPLSGYGVSAVSPMDGTTFADVTNDEGQFSLVNVTSGTWLLQVHYYSTLLTQRGITLKIADGKSISEIDTDFIINGRGTLSGFLIDVRSQLPAPISGEIQIARLDSHGKMYERLFRDNASHGCFALRNLLPGRYVIIDNFKGYVFNEPDSPIVTIYPDSFVGGVEVLLKEGASLHGNFIDAENGQPLSGVNVQVASEKNDSIYPNWEFMHETETDSDGTFWLTTPNDVHKYYRFSIIAISPRYQAQRFHFDMSPGKRRYHLGDIVLKRMLSLEGNVSAPKDVDVTGLVVRLKMHATSGNFFRPAAETELTTQTDTQGNFLFDELYPIEYTLTISRNDVIVAYIESVNPENESRISVGLPQLKRLYGRVVDAQQLPVPAAQISATRYSRTPYAHSGLLAETETDANGEFQMQVLETEARLLSIDVGKKGYFSTMYENVDIGAEPLMVTLEKGVMLVGQVILPSNVPPDGYYGVKIFPADARMSPALERLTLQKPLLSRWFPVTQSNFTIESLFPGKYKLYVAGPGIAAAGVEVDISRNENNALIVADMRTETLRGQVCYADTDAPVRNALVSRSWYPWELAPYDMSMTLDRFETETDEDGQFVFAELTDAPYQLRILAVKRMFDKETRTYRQIRIHKQVDFIYPQDTGKNRYRIYLGRRDGTSFQSP